ICIPVLAAVRVTDETLLGHVQRTPQAPERGVHKISGGVLGRPRDIADFFGLAPLLFGFQPLPERSFRLALERLQLGGDLRVDLVFPSLELPDLLPDLALAQSARLVAQLWEERDGFRLGEPEHERLHVHARVTLVQLGHGHEIGVTRRAVRERAGRLKSRIGPVGGGFQAVQQPSLERTPGLLVPWLDLPATFGLRSFNKPDVPVLLDEADSPFNEGPVICWPVGGYFRCELGAKAFKPFGLKLSRGDATRHEYL